NDKDLIRRPLSGKVHATVLRSYLILICTRLQRASCGSALFFGSRSPVATATLDDGCVRRAAVAAGSKRRCGASRSEACSAPGGGGHDLARRRRSAEHTSEL